LKKSNHVAARDNPKSAPLALLPDVLSLFNRKGDVEKIEIIASMEAVIEPHLTDQESRALSSML